MSTNIMTDTDQTPTSQSDDWAKVRRFYPAMVVIIFLVAIAARAIDVWRPVDGTIRDTWREPDVAGIARNYYEEGMNFFEPRIDWRGDGPGYVESEFPLYPWTVACLYHVFGYHEELLRVVSFVLSVIAFAVFYRVARYTLPQFGVLAACTVFAISPMAIRMASAIQPEPLMFLGYMSGAYFFMKWCREQTRFHFWMSLAMTTLAILGKIPAAHIGILYAILCFQHFGWITFTRKEIWGYAFAVLAIPIAWYAYAHSLYAEYGNSLGMSNEAYVRISSMSFIEAMATTIPGVLAIENELLWSPTGWVMGIIGVIVAFRNSEQSWIVSWLLALICFYVVTGRTTGESWAHHYHIVSTPVVALLLGAASAVFPAMIRRANETTAMPFSIGTLFLRRGFAVALFFLMATTLLFHARRVNWDIRPTHNAHLYEAATELSPLMTRDSLIVASGAGATDQYGLMRAFNAPYFFFWTGRKGFTLTNEEQDIASLEDYRQRGASYFFAERRCLKLRPEFEGQLRERYRVLGEKNDVLLIELEPPTNVGKTEDKADEKPKA